MLAAQLGPTALPDKCLATGQNNDTPFLMSVRGEKDHCFGHTAKGATLIPSGVNVR